MLPQQVTGHKGFCETRRPSERVQLCMSSQIMAPNGWTRDLVGPSVWKQSQVQLVCGKDGVLLGPGSSSHW